MTQTGQTPELTDIAARIWDGLGGSADLVRRLTATGPRTVLPSQFDVTGLATASVAAATVAAAEFLAVRNDRGPLPVTVDSRQACAAFAAEALFTPVGWERPDIWDPIAGNYRARDGWIRLHTNYAYHRAAVERLLGAADRESVRAAVAEWKAEELETAVVEAGGCAAVMRTREEWLAAPAGAATADAPLAAVTDRPVPDGAGGAAGGRDAGRAGVRRAGGAGRAAGTGGRLPYSDVRVLDLTRVIAGPVGTRFLAAYGADVLRIDPPGFAEVPALLPETTVGKRTAALDLTAAAGRAAFESLVGTADVLVSGLRADALAGLGYDDAALAALNPELIVASLDAYGWGGPWRNRRGFDSLVQMSSGIAAAGAAATGADHPVPLPVQALDHACGYLTAAAVGRALTRRRAESAVSRIRLSLIGTANLLWSLPRPAGQPPMPKPGDFPLTDARTAWGPARRVPLPGAIAGVDPQWRVEAGPLGRHRPAWAGASGS
jgi:CoA-transferase family III